VGVRGPEEPVMKRAMLVLVLLIGFSLPRAANAGIFLCNETGEKLFVAIGYQENGQWLSRGWFSFEPRECNSLYLGVPQNQYFYYYANSASWKTAWSGEQDSNGGYFCTSDKAFYFLNDSNSCVGKSFKLLDLNGADQYTLTLGEQKDPKVAALNCQSEIQSGRDAFAKCWMRNMATEKQADILDCWDKSADTAGFAICASKGNLGEKEYQMATCAGKYNDDKITSNFVECIVGTQFNEKDGKLINCAIENGNNYAGTLGCAAVANLSPEQQKLYQCVANNTNSYAAIGVCVASDRLDPEQSRIASCVLNNSGSYTQMGVCAAGNNLTPEQQAFVSCAITSGGQPYAYVGCVGTTLTLNELEKCLTSGIGGSGCFGDNNSAVKFVTNAFKDITEGPGPSNDLLGRDGWVGRTAQNIGNDLTYGPGESNDLVGRDGWLCQNVLGGC
jgi:uncharacterized membrane protein